MNSNEQFGANTPGNGSEGDLLVASLKNVATTQKIIAVRRQSDISEDKVSSIKDPNNPA